MDARSLALNEYSYLTKERIPISTRTLSERFGVSSYFYRNAKQQLEKLFTVIRLDPIAKSTLNGWTKIFEKIYGYQPDVTLFIDHVYLIILAKTFLHRKLGYNELSKLDIAGILDNRFFQNKGIKNLNEKFSGWLLIPEIKNEAVDFIRELSGELFDFDLSIINEDLFSGLYQEIIERQERHKAGEYYTPEWLVELILKDALSIWDQQNDGKVPKILDPACGSGSFIFRAIKIFRERQCSLAEIISSVQGFDVNPIAAFIAIANYILAIDDLIGAENEIRIPIDIKDSLRSPDLFDDSIKLAQYDMLVGNPPWVVLRSLKNKGYQEFLKREVLKYGLLEQREVHLFTQMELATVLFCKSADLYLNNGGIVAYVMPRSVLAGTKHHVNFRKFGRPLIKLLKIIDLEDVNPLFNVPACVLIGLKGATTQYPVLIEKYSGKLNRLEEKIINANVKLFVQANEYSPPNFSVKPSYYYNKFRVGASIFPRSLYFVDIISAASESNKVSVKTSEDILQIVKAPWGVTLTGEIDPKYLYATLLAWEIFPFGFSRLRPVILPIKENSGGSELIEINEFEKDADQQTAKWFRDAQLVWHERRTQNSVKRFPKLSDRLNYNRLLSIQNRKKRYIVVYNATGTNLAACVIDRLNLPSFRVHGQQLTPAGFILDVKTWFYQTQNLMEAHYLSALLNSERLNKLIKPLQPNGLFGARAIHRRPFLLSIPQFSNYDESHMKLAEISMRCKHKIEKIKLNQSNRIRGEVRRLLKDEISEIDSIVELIMNSTIAED